MGEVVLQNRCHRQDVVDPTGDVLVNGDSAAHRDSGSCRIPYECVDRRLTVQCHKQGRRVRVGVYITDHVGPDGQVREVARDLPMWLRLDYLISCWAQTPEEEQLLLGATIKTIMEHPTIRGADLKGESFEPDDYLPLLLSQKLDETVLSRFWSSLNQPLKPAVQCWTTIPLYPTTARPITRVREREVRFFDLDKLNRLRQ